jgi:hypothetical protein
VINKKFFEYDIPDETTIEEVDRTTVRTSDVTKFPVWICPKCKSESFVKNGPLRERCLKCEGKI